MNPMKSIAPVIVGLGEVLWDMFPDGARFGGAPANFACCAAGLAREHAHVYIASAVGREDLGQRAIAAVREHGVQRTLLDELDFPTGRVDVCLDPSGQASYEFAANTAWDNLRWTEDMDQIARESDAVCFGTLGQRSSQSEDIIRRFVARTSSNCIRLLDINLRPPYWTDRIVLQSLSMANALKLNEDELPIVARVLAIDGSAESLMQQLVARYNLRWIALTLGPEGSLLMDSTGETSRFVGTPVSVADTVGAGDGFAAALVVGMLHGLPLQVVHRWANDVASFVCTQPGATPSIPSPLQLSRTWNGASRAISLDK
jgi:fructokinase